MRHGITIIETRLCRAVMEAAWDRWLRTADEGCTQPLTTTEALGEDPPPLRVTTVSHRRILPPVASIGGPWAG